MDPLILMAIIGWVTNEYIVVVVAVVAFLVMRRRLTVRGESASTTPVFASGIVVVAGVMGIIANLGFLLLPLHDASVRYAIVPAVGVLLQIVLLVAAARWARRSRDVERGIDPRSRSWGSFLTRGSVATGAVLLALTVVTVVLAGVTSTSDPRGRYDRIRIDTPDGYAEASFPGWYYTVPVLIAVLLLIALTIVTLMLIARPTNPRDEHDLARRRGASQAAGVALATLAVTLGRLWIFVALGAGTATQVTTDQGSAWIVPSFQAVGPFLGAGGVILVGVGLAGFALLIAPRRPRAKGAAIEAESK